MRIKAKNADSIEISGLSLGKACAILNILNHELKDPENEIRRGLLAEFIPELNHAVNNAERMLRGEDPLDNEKPVKQEKPLEESGDETAQVVFSDGSGSEKKRPLSREEKKAARAERKAARLAKREAKRLAREERRKNKK